MINYTIGEEYIRSSKSSSLGATKKYFFENYWYKENFKGYEGKSEQIVSTILGFTNLQESQYVKYEECLINGKPGCRSLNFLKDNQAIATFSRLYFKAYGSSLKEKISLYSTPEDRIEYVIDEMYKITRVDCRQYLKTFAQIDFLTLDVDRHFDNLAFIKEEESFKIAPFFDFGASYFSLQHVFKPEMSLEEKLNIMTPQPFCDNLEKQMKVFGEPDLKLDYDKIEKYIDDFPDEIRIPAKYQLSIASQYFNELNPTLNQTKTRR